MMMRRNVGSKYLQNLRFELDGHRLCHGFDFVDELDACISRDRHDSVARSLSLSLSLCHSVSLLAGRLGRTVAVFFIRLDACLQRE